MSETFKLGEKEVTLDENLLKFDEATLNDFFKTFASYYNEYQSHYSDAQYYFSALEDKYDSLWAEKFAKHKETSGGSDKLVEAKVDCDEEIVNSLRQVRSYKNKVNKLHGFLRSMDRAHEQAVQLSFNMRKELDKLYPVTGKII